jgi:outer membrane receptor protein involved in Fe transport
LPGQNIQSRNNLTIRGTSDINKFMKLDANVMYTHEKVKNRVYKNGSTRNPAYSFLYMQRNADLSSYIPWKDPNGNAYGGYGDVGAINPYWLLNENSNEDLSDRLISQVSLNTKITPHLNFRVKAAGDMQFVTGWEFNNMGAVYDIDGYYRKFNVNTSNLNYEWLASYNKEIGKFSTVVNMGGNWYDQIINGTDTRINTLLVSDVKSLANVNGIPTAVENDVRKRITSLFGSASVGFKKIAYLDATLRRDWSSSLPTAYTYPSVGGSVVFSDLLPKNNILSFGKLRASWAEVSNDASPYSLNNTYGYGGNFNGIAWVNYSTTGKNPQLKPEQTRSTEFGLEAVLFNNRIKANVTHYNSSTVDQIVNASVSSTTGFSKRIYNAGEIRNKGWEIALSGSIVNKPFKWDMDINWSKNKSLVVSLIPGVTSFELSRWFNVQVLAEVGQPYGLLRGNAVRKDSKGDILVNANGRIMFDANQIIGNSEPDWIGSINNSFSYKGFSLGFLIDVKWGGDMYSATMLKATNQGIMASTLEGRDEFFFSSVVLGENDNERKGVGLYNNSYLDIERIKGFIYPNSYIGVQDPVTKAWAAGAINNNFINPQFPNVDLLNDQASLTYDASYIKLRELTIGYQLPKGWLSKTPVNEARFSLVGRNLYTLFRNTPIGLDPESTTTSGNGQGIEFGAFLPTRTYGFNIKLSF